MALLSHLWLFPDTDGCRIFNHSEQAWEQVVRRAITLTIAVMMFCIVVGALKTTAVAQQKSLKEQILGTWVLVSNVVERQDGTKADQFGPNPRGMLIFAHDGRFATVNARADLPKLASGNRSRTTPEENKAVVEGSLAYYGTYAVSDSERIITVHVEGSTFANQLGAVSKRLVASITSDEMRLTNPAATSGGSLEQVWKRAK